MRDNDRQKVYDAEGELRVFLSRPGSFLQIHGSTIVVPDERKFGRVEDIQRYVDAVLAHIGRENDNVKVRIRRGQTKAHYEYMTQTIAIPAKDEWALRETVVLHEIAHHLTGPGVHHGAQFRSNFTSLLEKVLGPEARFLMQVAYFDRGLTA